MTDDPDHVPEAVDWQGSDLDCTTCPNASLNQAGRCRAGHACVFDRYARRIDRYFRWNPTTASEYVDHPYFEVRAIIAKHVDVFHLQRLSQDHDETVRLSVAMRIPQRGLLRMRGDVDREVRIRVAQRIDVAELGPMMNDPDYFVRVIVARRLPVGMLRRMILDPDPEVRCEVAKRIDEGRLYSMCNDPEASVRLIVAQRLPAALLAFLAGDIDWRIRFEVARRTDDATLLQRLSRDEDPMVSEAARERLSIDVRTRQTSAEAGS